MREVSYTVTCMDEPEFRYHLPKRRPRPEPWSAGRVAALRTELGLSQAAFAAELGVRQQTVSEWETGRYQPRGASGRMLHVLAEARARYEAGEREG